MTQGKKKKYRQVQNRTICLNVNLLNLNLKISQKEGKKGALFMFAGQ